MKKPAKQKSVVMTVRERKDKDFDDPREQIEPFGTAIKLMQWNHQSMTVEIQLPAYMWLMLSEIAARDQDNFRTIGDVISNLVYCSPSLRAQWLKSNRWEGEILEKVLEEIVESGAFEKLDRGLSDCRERLKRAFVS